MFNLHTTKSTILLVDDEAINLAVIGNLLVPYYQVLVATSGELALEIAQGVPRPDLILLDVMMPDMNGYEVLSRLKASAECRDIPVIFVTSLDADFEEERGFELGAVDFISKPVQLSTLLARMRTHIELKHARDSLQSQNEFLEAEVERRQQAMQQVQMQLLQSEKLAAIGQLAAGLAHEINNPIGFVNSNLTTLKGYFAEIFQICKNAGITVDTAAVPSAGQSSAQAEIDYMFADTPQLIDESLEGLARVRKLIQDLKNFTHVDSNNWELADVHVCLDTTLNLIWNELKYHCQVIKQYGDIPQIYCLPSQLNQVFMNLLINAGQAIKKQGEITIQTGCLENKVWVEIADSGEGIAPEHLNHLFEPFFTTKPVGKGTGLGLSISHNIVEKHGGSIEVRSEPGNGTRFRVYLPVLQG